MITWGDWMVLVYVLVFLVVFCGVVEWIAKHFTK